MDAATPDIIVSPVRALRQALGLTLAEMGERCGISKSQMHEVERTGRASLPVALEIERLSLEATGIAPVDAAGLSEDVRKARHGIGCNTALAEVSSGNIGESSRG